MRGARRLWFAAGWLAVLTTAVHVLAGTPEVAPFLRGLPPEIGLMLLACWHLVSVALGSSAAALLWCAWRGHGTARGLAGAIATMWLLFGLVFVVVSTAQWGWHGLTVLPQWILLLPVAVLAGAGACGRGWRLPR